MSAGDESDTVAFLPSVAIDKFPDAASKALVQCAMALNDAEPFLAKYNSVENAGNCGITMEQGAREFLQRLDSWELALKHPSLLFSNLANAFSKLMGGASSISTAGIDASENKHVAFGGTMLISFLAW